MRFRISEVLLMGVALALSGCATITKGTTQQVSITTPGAPGAQCKLFSSAVGEKTVVTPATIVLEKSQQNISITCKKPCFQDGWGLFHRTRRGWRPVMWS